LITGIHRDRCQVVFIGAALEPTSHPNELLSTDMIADELKKNDLDSELASSAAETLLHLHVDF
jgi:hypothetical protein